MQKRQRLKKILITPATTVAMFMACEAHGGNATSTFEVSATVLAACTVSAENLAFGDYISDSVQATSNIALTCTNGTPYTVALDKGTSPNAGPNNRQMTGGGSAPQYLDYALYQDVSQSIYWGDNPNVSTQDGTGTGSQSTLTVYGLIPAQQRVTSGSYSDTITITITY